MEMVTSEQFGNESEKSSADSSSEFEDEKEGRPESEEYQKLNESSSSADLLEDAPKLAEPKGICNFFLEVQSNDKVKVTKGHCRITSLSYLWSIFG